MQVHIVAKDKGSLPELELQAELFDAGSGEPAAPSQTVRQGPLRAQGSGCRVEPDESCTLTAQPPNSRGPMVPGSYIAHISQVS